MEQCLVEGERLDDEPGLPLDGGYGLADRQQGHREDQRQGHQPDRRRQLEDADVQITAGCRQDDQHREQVEDRHGGFILRIGQRRVTQGARPADPARHTISSIVPRLQSPSTADSRRRGHGEDHDADEELPRRCRAGVAPRKGESVGQPPSAGLVQPRAAAPHSGLRGPIEVGRTTPPSPRSCKGPAHDRVSMTRGGFCQVAVRIINVVELTSRSA